MKRNKTYSIKLIQALLPSLDGTEETIRGKWIMDGAVTLSEAARKLQDYSLELEHLERQGWQLQDPIEDDYGIISKDE